MQPTDLNSDIKELVLGHIGDELDRAMYVCLTGSKPDLLTVRIYTLGEYERTSRYLLVFTGADGWEFSTEYHRFPTREEVIFARRIATEELRKHQCLP